MMQAVMEFSLPNFGRFMGACSSRLRGIITPVAFDVSTFAFNVENGIDGSRGMLNIAVLTC
jgi:hypothetical protein